MSTEHTKPRNDSIAAALEEEFGRGAAFPPSLTNVCDRGRACAALERLRDALQRHYPGAWYHPVLAISGRQDLPDARAVADHLVVFMLESCGEHCPLLGEPVARGHLNCPIDTAVGHLASCRAHRTLFAALLESFAGSLDPAGESDAFLNPFLDAVALLQEEIEEYEEDRCPFRVPIRCADKRVVFFTVEDVHQVQWVRDDCARFDFDPGIVTAYEEHLRVFAKSFGLETLPSQLLETARVYFYRMRGIPLASESGSGTPTED